MTEPGGVLERLEASLRAAGSQARLRVRTATFDIFVSEDSASYLMNFAVPRGPDPGDWFAAVLDLREAFAAHGRCPRLEYFRELHPGLAIALEAQGFTCDHAAPLMVLRKAALPEVRPLSRAALVSLAPGDREGLEAFVRAQDLAFGGQGDALEWLPQLEWGLEAGRVMIRVLLQDGRPMSGAVIQLGGEVGELAGVWTAAEARRRGLAHAVCHDLLVEYFAAGYDLCWLSAAEGAQGVYQTLGFQPVGTQLNYGQQEGS